MKTEFEETLLAFISERLTKEIKKIKSMQISTANDYGNNLHYFHKILDEEYKKAKSVSSLT